MTAPTVETAGVSEETMLTAIRTGCILNEVSLQTIIDSPKFRDYEKAMARELLAARQQLAELREANAAALRVSLIHTATHEIAKVREERDEAREAVEDIEKERDKLLQHLAEMRAKYVEAILNVDGYKGLLSMAQRKLTEMSEVISGRLRDRLLRDLAQAGCAGTAQLLLDALAVPDALAPTSQPSRGKCGCLSDDEHNWLTAAIMDLRAGESISGADAALILDRIATRHCPGYLGCAQPERQDTYADIAADLASRQVDLPADLKRVLYDNRRSLYIKADPVASPPQDDIVAGKLTQKESALLFMLEKQREYEGKGLYQTAGLYETAAAAIAALGEKGAK